MGGEKLPIYTYCCEVCGEQKEIIHSMNETKVPKCCGKKMQRDFQADIPNAGNRDYSRPIVSDSLAINPSQRTEHEQMFPNIKLDNECRPIFDNYQAHEDYLKKTGFVKTPQRKRRKFASKIGGKKNNKRRKIRKNKTISS